MITNSASSSSSAAPTTSERLRPRYCRTAFMSCAPIRDAGIQQRIEDVEHEGRQAECDDDGEHDALDQELVVLADRLEQQRADAGRAADHLHQRRAGQYHA